MSVLATFTRLDAATDGQLLGRFVQSRDADAFAALVRRLGPAVLAVCRRVCPDAHLAEDAFQAAFLVLATKAEAVKPRERVAVWLYGVAYRTASKARSMLAARRRRETDSATLPDPPTPDAVGHADDAELRTLDAAIAGLPDHLRAAVVLCELEGRSRKDAAKQLGIPEGTLSSRLADARKRLGERLRPTKAVVTAALATSTAEAAVSGTASETVKFLARGVMSMMLLNKLKLPAVALLVVTTLSGVTFALWPTPVSPVAAAPVPKELKRQAGLFAVTRGGEVHLLAPDGTEAKRLCIQSALKNERPGERVSSVRAFPSPTGGFPLALLVSWSRHTGVRGGEHTCEVRLVHSPDEPKGVWVDPGERAVTSDRLVWSRDGKRLYATCWATNADHAAGWLAQRKHLLIDPDSGKADDAPLPQHHQLFGETPDGRLVTVIDGGPEVEREVGGWPLRRVSADGKTVEKLTPFSHPGSVPALDLSPDGRTVLSARFDKTAGTDVLHAFDCETGRGVNITPKEFGGGKVEIHQVRWSPDGKSLGFVCAERNGRPAGEADRVLYVCDRDGSNGKAVFTWSGKDEIWDARFEWN